jgi:quinol monooxygenase YgiN
MIIIAGTISIPAEKRAGCLEASLPLQQATRDDEPGCLAYVFSADPCRDGVMAVYELWADGPSLAAHFLHPNYTNMRALFGQHGITGADVKKYRTDADGPVYNSSGVATVEFG